MQEPYTSPKIPFASILRWQLNKFFSKKSSTAKRLPVQIHTDLPSGEYAMWIGHASVWMHISSTTLCIDPVLGNIPMHRRFSPLPLPISALRTDIILITHAHYDHYDKTSVQLLLDQNPDLIIVAPEGFWRYMKGLIGRERCFELHWWESVMIKGLFITLTPAKHWSKRTLFDTNKALWGGYVIQNGGHTLFHSGDSAYGGHFNEIAERFEIDEAFLPIGAYRPEWIMRRNHLNPPEAIQAAIDLRAKYMIPIHYGTFVLSDEPLLEPIEWFEELTGTNSYPFVPQTLDIGEIYRFKTMSTPKST